MKSRIVYPKNIWFNKDFHKLSILAQTIGIYLVTNDNIGLSRIYQQKDLEVQFLFKISGEKWESIKEELHGLFFFKDEWVYINNDFSYCDYEGRDRVMSSKAKELGRIPSEVTSYFEEVLKGLERGYKPTINHKYKIINNKSKKKEEKFSEQQKKDIMHILNFYNYVFEKSSTSPKSWMDNYLYWSDFHNVDKIKTALVNARKDDYWKDKLDLTILFRRKDTNGENVDRIDKFYAQNPNSLTEELRDITF